MGVKGLWRLLMPIGRRVSIETLEGKILAIDASIWLTQFVKAMRDPETGSVRPAAHLIGFFRRLAKLRFHGIRPVLVFDGATPVIKLRELAQRRQRREQLSAKAAEGTMKRIAKQILVKELKKQKAEKKKGAGDKTKSNSTAAVSEGFTLAPGTEVVTQTQKESDGDDGDSDDRPERALTKIEETSEEIARALQQEEWENAVPTQQNEDIQNDWDNAIIENEDDEPKAKKQKTLKGHLQGYDLRQLSSLAPSARKDVIEDAKRQQRMRSRREFMPVAGKAADFSSVQLKNFLRSAKFNKDITKMVKDVAQKQQGGIGEQIASDATRRIIFEKFDDKKKRSRLLQRRPEEESDSELEWESGDEEEDEQVQEVSVARQAPSRSNPGRAAKAKRKKIVESLSSDESDGEGGGFLPQSNESLKPVPRSRNDQVAVKPKEMDSESDDEGGGGFLPASNDDDEKKPAARPSKCNASAKAETTPVAESDSDLEDGGGAVLPTGEQPSVRPSSAAVSKTVFNRNLGESGAECSTPGALIVHIDSDSDDDGGGFVRSQDSSTEKSQRTMKEAGALIANVDSGSEDDEGGKIDKGRHEGAGSHTLVVQRTKGGCLATSVRQDTVVQNLEDEMLARALHESENDTAGTVLKDRRKLTKNSPVFKPGDYASKTKTSCPVTLNSSDGEHSSGDDGDDVMWEDGDDGNEDETKLKGTGPDLQGDDENVEWEDGDGSSNDYEADGVIEGLTSATQENYTDSFPSKMSSSFEGTRSGNDFESVNVADQTAKALEHAQSTAANLTNWAGRAFRRAIAQHAEETGTTLANIPPPAPPKVTEARLTVDHSHEDTHTNGENRSNSLSGSNPTGTSAGARELVNPHKDKETMDLTGLGKDDSARESSRPTLRHRDPPLSVRPMDQLESVLGPLHDESLLSTEEKRFERDMDTVTDEMKSEVIRLIELFGIPYVQSPAEAEAQCAALEQLGLIDGIVTEDSDVFVFGGRNVYKNIFDDKKYVEAYTADSAEKDLALGHNQMVALAMLLGGDYTDGVKGVGIVNGMEILQAFDFSESAKDGLLQFRKWLDGFDPADALGSNSKEAEVLTGEQRFHLKHRSARSRWAAPKHFPAPDVLNAYINPVVDKSTDPFSWGVPDLERLQNFNNRNMGLENAEVKMAIESIIKRSGSGMQTRLESFFMRYEDDIKFADVKSKRLRDVFRENRSKKENCETGAEPRLACNPVAEPQPKQIVTLSPATKESEAKPKSSPQKRPRRKVSKRKKAE